MTAVTHNRAGLAILSILIGMTAISLNDMLIKQLSGGYALHQIVFARSAIGIFLSLVLVHFEGGFHLLKTDQKGMHVLRGVLIVISNMTFFVALAALPLAEATAHRPPRPSAAISRSGAARQAGGCSGNARHSPSAATG